ncbi:MAG: helix-turn-helix domain-containing protein [Rhizobiales bacterium]|nr:helix-turn-helix domain-containing protein [Hyphomicrobiales bacterium]
MAVNPDPLKQWRELIGRRLLNLDFSPANDAPFRSRLDPLVEGGGVQVVGMTFTPGVTIRNRELIRDGRDDYALTISRACRIEANQYGRWTRIGPGEATLFHATEPGTFGAGKTHGYAAILIPADHLASRIRGLDDIAATRIAHTNEALVLLRAYVRTLASATLTSADVRAAAVAHVLDLTELVLSRETGRSAEEKAACVHEVRLQIALDFIARRFRDPSLCVPVVAASQGISVRYLQKLFERSGLRFTEHVNALRLAEAHRLLTATDAGERSIIEVAMASGFSDVSHFNRLFRRRYDATPGALKSQAARSAP